MSYVDGSFGEAAFGESPGGGFPASAGVVGSMGAIEAADILSAFGTVPVASRVAIADPNMLVIVVELELGQLN
jgi:hypothetical protein